MLQDTFLFTHFFEEETFEPPHRAFHALQSPLFFLKVIFVPAQAVISLEE